MKRYAAIIAAAGLSSRMKNFKPLMCLEGIPMIDRTIHSFTQAGVDEIVVVVGYNAKEMKKHLSSMPVTVVDNLRFAETGMFESFLVGLEEIESRYDYVFLSPGDVPLIQPDTINLLKGTSGDVVRPICNGRRGHPIMIAKNSIVKIKEYQGAEGLRGALKALPMQPVDVVVEDPGIYADADTPEDFMNLCRTANMLHKYIEMTE